MIFQIKKKLVFLTSFFFIISPTLAAPQIQVRFRLTGDLDFGMSFTGPMGANIIGQPDPSGPKPLCESSALFRKVSSQQSMKIEVWLKLICPSKEQKVTLSPPRFFLDEKGPINTVELRYLTHEYKKIHVTISELSISEKIKK
ncbi:MAG: hypothetical protein A2622_12175 [Bdellovibrionales bacterium RIFCSPHIGHO2_01_FULL_40_29]|nr:MAG: hypothetical protein A2622_12175 [Bdellovibrionales bacterium RIFCSPHIGHO2_01_FULL_40_29]OFZ32946.1 MAG: hypothetical protein A3D17_09480 [Bdellovibrionales bacterium RIFCSPHIGHO2_02_FULL_40_15]